MKVITDKFKYMEDREVCGLTKELLSIYIANYYKNNNESILVLANSLYEANNFYKSLQAYIDDVLFFPMDDFMTSVALAASPDLKVTRLDTLDRLSNENKKHIVVTCLMGFLKYLPNKNKKGSLLIEKDSKIISREIILNCLEEFGYHRESLVTVTGEYAVRGFIIDVFPIQSASPVRIEFFGDEIGSLKEFDENSQRTTKEIENFELKTFDEMVDMAGGEYSPLMSYLGDGTLFEIDAKQIENAFASLQKNMLDYSLSKELPGDTKYMFDLGDIKYAKHFKLNTINAYQDDESLVYTSNELENFNSQLDILKSFVKKESKSKTIIFALQNEKQKREIEKLFEEAYVTGEDSIIENKINIIMKKMSAGFTFDSYIVITPYDIDRSIKKDIRYKNTIKIGRKIKTFSDLSVGDYIVHEIHGIGIYRGLKTLKTGSYLKDYLELEYLDKDKVYIPVDNINSIYKYSSGVGSKPKLNKLNSGAWAKKKIETRKKIADISQELIELYSNRKRITGPSYTDYDEELKFAFSFPYSLTQDQERSIKEIEEDLRQLEPMDRLLCGDVGYGKTEVAFRAMFKTVLNGYQVSYLCPTTILSRQQYLSAIDRFKDYPINIALLNRHVSQRRISEIVNGLKEGKIDIVIGTHKLLNDKIKYKKLGLLVIDEEQRFGVTHKEKIKKMKTDVNVLTLSATPIPRTLKLAMSGLRSLSILDTPPINRYPIQTYVIEENDLIIRDAIYKELTRSGQIYILINSIEELDKYRNKVAKLVPEASVVCGHGQLASEELNDIMQDFIDGKYDILICTTIIETGIDIPNVNTIIIIDSDKFGLSQLYQIRGRVGRSDKIAYAYLMYNPAKILTETAMKRLESIKEFTELGSGYKIAMRDLAIRGAGDLLGREQAGFIDAVGLDLYTKMVEEEVSKLEGCFEEKEKPGKKIELNVSTHIADEYVSDEEIKIEIHKLINSIETRVDFAKVKRELEDRFGNITEDIEVYMLEKCVENLIKKMRIQNVIQLQRSITIVLPEEISSNIDGEKLFLECYNINSKFELSYKNKEIRITLKTDNLKKNYIYYIFELLSSISGQTIDV